MMGLPYGEEIMIVGQTMWTQSTSVTDGRTDGRTDRRTELRSQRPCNAELRTVKTEGDKEDGKGDKQWERDSPIVAKSHSNFKNATNKHKNM